MGIAETGAEQSDGVREVLRASSLPPSVMSYPYASESWERARPPGREHAGHCGCRLQWIERSDASAVM